MTRRVGIFGWVIFSAFAARAEKFTDSGAPLTGVRLCSVAWGDYDNDGDLDLLVAGNGVGGANRFAQIAKNEGGVFTETDVGLDGATMCSVAWGDYDGDGDLDVAISGSGSSFYITRVYGNEGGDVFADIGAGMPGFYNCSLAWGDHDLDGDVDLALAGFGPPMVCTVFRNEGDDNFTDVEAGMEAVNYCSLAWGDYDSDGDLDLLVGGKKGGAGEPVTRIYSNTSGVMEDITAGLAGVKKCAVGWADYDSDGELDLALCGFDNLVENSRTTKVYENNGGFFSVYATLTGVSGAAFNSSLAWGDFDADGDPDLVVAGFNGSAAVTTVYEYDLGSFTALTGESLPGVYDCSVAWGDYDSDGDLDLAIAGDTGGGWETHIYDCNVDPGGNPAPSAPGVLVPAVNDQDVTLSWTASDDNNTPQAGLTYNLRVGTAVGKDDIMASMSDSTTGRRLVPAMGNVGHNLSWTLQQLPQTTYYWAVQAVDAGFVASGWTEGAFFEVFDTTPPTIVLPTDPYDGETQVAPDRLVRVTFSEPMNVALTEAVFSISPSVTGSFSWIGNTLIFAASPALSGDTGYTVTIGGGGVDGAPDLAGNRLETDYSFWFTTPDIIPPTVVPPTTPDDGATDVDPSQPITVTFSEQMNAGKTNAATSIAPIVSHFFSWSQPSMSIYAVGGRFADETEYTVTIGTGAEDASENALAAEYVFSFTTGEYTAPSPPGDFVAAPQGVDSISLTWSEPPEPDYPGGIVILRSDSGSPSYVPSRGETFTVANTYGNAVCIYSGVGLSFGDGGLSEATLYYYAAYSFDDKGNYSAPALAEAETSAAVFPEVVSTVPPDGAEDAAPTTTVEITFSKPMKPTETETAFAILPDVAGVFTWEGDTLVFTPNERLTVGETYTVTVAVGAKDLDGYNLAVEFAFSFLVSERPSCGDGGCGAQVAVLVVIALCLRRRS